MLSRIQSATVVGLDVIPVDVEVDVGPGLPNVTIVGLADTAVNEAKERVRSAIRNANMSLPRTRVTINLAPADVRKEGSLFDVPIAMGMLAADGAFPKGVPRALFVGELALDGTVRSVDGVLPMVRWARSADITTVFVPCANCEEASLIEDVTVFGVATLEALLHHVREEKLLSPYQPSALSDQVAEVLIDMADIAGQEQAKRILEIAAAGNHTVLFSGPPGTGKTMLAKALAGILPPLEREEMLDVIAIHSVAGLLSGGTVVHARPFRAPHHSASVAALVGGGTHPRPGEITLAHRGVLFLDELPEFPRNVLEALRQPIEDGVVLVSRAAAQVRFPARPLLVAAQNPCPCGYLGDEERACQCTSSAVAHYARKISGPLLDRFDLFGRVPRVSYQDLQRTDTQCETSSAIRERVISARTRARQRFTYTTLTANAEMGVREIREYCKLDTGADRLLEQAVDRFHLSGRGVHRVLKVARTIADLAGSDTITMDHVAEALQYRNQE